MVTPADIKKGGTRKAAEKVSFGQYKTGAIATVRPPPRAAR
jgi:hypothetical protein